MTHPNLTKLNNATRLTTMVLGITLAASGLHHGFYEILQGNTATNSLIIQSISPEYQQWDNGEEAFTLIPNFLATGIVAVCISLFIIFWSIRFLHRRSGPIVFLLLFILLTLTGGGIGHIVFFVPVWAYSTRMHKSLSGWQRMTSAGFRGMLSKIWKISLILTSAFLIIALEISVFGIPGVKNDETILTVCWSFLLASFLLLHLTYL